MLNAFALSNKKKLSFTNAKEEFYNLESKMAIKNFAYNVRPTVY